MVVIRTVIKPKIVIPILLTKILMIDDNTFATTTEMPTNNISIDKWKTVNATTSYNYKWL